MATIPPHEMLTRRRAAEFCKALGYKVESTSLATMAWKGVGPPYTRVGERCCLYDRSDLIRWVEARQSARRGRPRRLTDQPAA